MIHQQIHLDIILFRDTQKVSNSYLHMPASSASPQILNSRYFIPKPDTSRTMNTPGHYSLYQRSNVLISNRSERDREIRSLNLTGDIGIG